MLGLQNNWEAVPVAELQTGKKQQHLRNNKVNMNCCKALLTFTPLPVPEGL